MSAISRAAATLAVVVIAAAGLAACGSSKKSSSGSSGSSGATSTSASGANFSVSPNPKIAAEVPGAIKSKGTLTVAADATYPPNEFIGPDGKTVVGMDADLAKALAQTMGLKAQVQNATFDTIIPGLAAKKYDLGMSSFTDTKAREKVVDFVTYFIAGTSFFTKAQGGATVNTLTDLCGKTVAVEKGTTQQSDATAQAKKCAAAKKPAVNVLVFPDQNGANLALSSGRAQVGMADSPVAAYQVKQASGQFKLVGQTYATAPYGIAVPKGTGMTKPILDALKALMAGGQYKTILDHWGISAGAMSNPKVNGATS